DDGHPAAVDLADAAHHAVGSQVALRLTEAGVHRVGEEAVLGERAWIEEEVEPLAHGQLPKAALTFDELGPAAGVGVLAAGSKVFDEWLPVVELGGVGHRRAYLPFQSGARFSAK